MVKNKKYLIDSSVVMALFNEEDRQNRKARLLFAKLKRERAGIKILWITIVELVSLMKYRKIIDWKLYSAKLVDESIFEIENSYVFSEDGLAWKLTMEKDKIGMIDAIEIEVGMKNKYNLLTFNKAQEKEWQLVV